MTLTTESSVRKSSVSSPTERLCRMLQNTLQSYPLAKVLRSPGAFGVSLDERTYLRLCWSGPLSRRDMRDLLVLFAAWLAVEPNALVGADTGQAGSSVTARERQKR